MRDSTQWYQSLSGRLKQALPSNGGLTAAQVCTVELGLYLLSQLAPDAPASALWVLLTGYPFPVIEAMGWNAVQRTMVGVGRHLLHISSRYQWERLLRAYRQIPDRVRGYEVDEDLHTFVPRAVTMAGDRFSVYAGALTTPPQHRVDKVNWAEVGTYLVDGHQFRRQVKLAAEHVFAPPLSYDLERKRQPAPVAPTWRELSETAKWMDDVTDGRDAWVKRLARVRLALFDDADTLVPSDTLRLQGLVHLIGMVSSGKSTLMDVLAVWAARSGLHVTLVVGDVIGVLNRAQQFAEMGLSVAPILGRFSREVHIDRLHRTLAAQDAGISPLLHEHIGFDWLSSACPLEELTNDQHESFDLRKRPCLALTNLSGKDRCACPLYGQCPYSQAQRDLVNASIWIATPASLVATRPDPQVCGAQVRFTELVYRRSDLVIVDEADRVQAQLDMAFSPHQVLTSKGSGGWLDNLGQKIQAALSYQGHGQMQSKDVAVWNQALHHALLVIDLIYGLLLSEPHLRDRIKRNYFTSWTLLNELANELVDVVPGTDPTDAALPEVFQSYLDDPLGDRDLRPLARLTRSLLSSVSDEQRQAEVLAWIEAQPEFTKWATLSSEAKGNTAVLLEFALYTAVLQDRLNLLIRHWREVEANLGLDEPGSLPFHPPPADYSAVLPASPTGNVLGFQYLQPDESDNTPGGLRFFRSMGVGRWWLLHLPELFAADGVMGPHTLLLSGTSWAGTAPGFHVQVPVAGVLQAPDEEIAAVRESRFEFDWAVDRSGQPVRVSGKFGHARTTALKTLLNYLAAPMSLSGASRLDMMRSQLPPSRQRILLVVGSYREAQTAGDYLRGLLGAQADQVRVLKPDDDETSDDHSLRRGLVHQLAETGAWLLIAPLLALERGHNILNEERKAAIGAAYFLVRPHPHPDDLAFSIHSLNQWAVDTSRDSQWFQRKLSGQDLALDAVGDAFRHAAHAKWRRLLDLPMRYTTLPPAERDAVTWNQLVTLWQLIGRLIRGGSPARIVFYDAMFAFHASLRDGQPDDNASSLLVSMRNVLRPYFDPASVITERDKELVSTLYGPFYQALDQLVREELTNGVP